MSNEHFMNIEHQKILIITSSGGGGLLQTANAKEQERIHLNPNAQIVKRDLLKDWIWKPIGQYFINFWNKAQMKGDVSAQKICVSGQVFADLFLHPIIFFYALYTLFKEDIDHIIDTQPLGTSAILKAVRMYSRFAKKRILLEKVLVDLPTKKATHFFRPIKRLSKKNRKSIFLTTIAPLLEEGETEEDFWKSTCNLSLDQIKLEDVYVRRAFQQFKGKEKATNRMRIPIRYKSKEEVQLMRKAFEKGSIQAKVKPDEVEFIIDPSDRMMTILLGSQPASEATIKYVKKIVNIAKEFPKTTMHLFVFCADHIEGEKTLFRQISELASRLKTAPKQLSIIPFSFQKEDVIAPLFFRSDVTCTRSGGQTAMELMCVSTGEIWVHSEAKKGEDLVGGIPGWEAASAVYLQKIRGATIVTPDRIHSSLKQLYQTSNGQERSNPSLESSA